MSSPFALPAQTSFESERSHHNFPGPSAEDAAESDYSDEESDPEQDATPRRSSRKRSATQASRGGDDQVIAVASMGCRLGYVVDGLVFGLYYLKIWCCMWVDALCPTAYSTCWQCSSTTVSQLT